MTFDRRLKPNINIDLTPLIDVTYQLVIFFMITSTFKTVPGIELDLPDSGTAAAVSVAELTVRAVSEDEVYVNDVLTNAAGAEGAIRESLGGRPSADVEASLEAGADAPYQLVIELLDALRKNGIDAVGLATRPKAEAP